MIIEITTFEQRNLSLRKQPLQVKDLAPLRVPLRIKPTKRCSSCNTILIKPELKAVSYSFIEKSVAM